MVDIKLIIDEKFVEPLVNIYTKSRTKQVESIIYAVENSMLNEYPTVGAYIEGKLSFISQRNIIRVQIVGRKIMLQTESGLYEVRGSLSSLEEKLDSERFFRISQSEIINLHKVDNFDLSVSGTVVVNFINGESSWVSRRRIKALKALLKNQ